MKKLRLLLTKDCNRNCKGCCNKDWDLDSLPVCTDFSEYDEIMLTGGEPMLYPALIMNAIIQIRRQNKNAKIYLYTAYLDLPETLKYLLDKHLDGIVLTLHSRWDKKKFQKLSNTLGYPVGKSLRLNVFKNVHLDYTRISPMWNAKMNMEWIKNCPLPKDEVFMKYGASPL